MGREANVTRSHREIAARMVRNEIERSKKDISRFGHFALRHPRAAHRILLLLWPAYAVLGDLKQWHLERAIFGALAED